jgi:hypothetical protein
MSRYEYLDLADRSAAAIGYVPAAARRSPSRPGLDALVIGNPEGTALVLEGTTDHLRVFVAKMAAKLPSAGKARSGYCGTGIEQGEPDGPWLDADDPDDKGAQRCPAAPDGKHAPSAAAQLAGQG